MTCLVGGPIIPKKRVLMARERYMFIEIGQLQERAFVPRKGA